MGIKKQMIRFGEFLLPHLSNLSYTLDGKPGAQVLFYHDAKDDMVISFEEGMVCMDANHQRLKNRRTIQAEYQEQSRYLHQYKILSEDKDRFNDIVFFHLEISDDAGRAHSCPGQMVLSGRYRQEEGVEPVLIELLRNAELACAI